MIINSKNFKTFKNVVNLQKKGSLSSAPKTKPNKTRKMKTFKNVVNLQKGGSLSSAPKTKPNKTRTMKDFKKVVKAAKFANFYTNYYSTKKIKYPKKILKKKPGRKFFKAYIAHLKKQKLKFSSSDTLKAIKRINKYSSQTQTHDLGTAYQIIRSHLTNKKNQFNKNSLIQLHNKFSKNPNTTKFSEQVQKILHPPQPPVKT